MPLFFCLFSRSPLAADPRPPSGIPEIDSLPLNDWRTPGEPLSAAKAVALSALVPGGGQFYGSHPVRGGFLAGLESLLFGLSLYAYFSDLPHLDRETGRLLDSANAAFDRMAREPGERETARLLFESRVRQARANAALRLQRADLANSELAWALGLHFYGMADALEIARRSRGSDPETRSIRRALGHGLAFPGGGQLYNGSYGKFGLLWMALGASALSAWSRQNVVESLNRSVDASRREDSPELDGLERDRTLYRKRRNQYYWGMALFYVYGVLDGMVDAALSDFDHPRRYALEWGPAPLSLTAVVRF